MLSKIVARSVAAVVVLLIAACSVFPEKKDVTAAWGEDRLYNEAKGLLDTEQYAEAATMYQSLQSRYPFGAHAQQGQIDLAYSYYKSEDYPSAVAAADRYIKLYPGQTGEDYAYYLRGLANYNQNKGLLERYLPTDTSQRDQGAAQLSFNDFAELVKRFPDSQYAEDSRLRMVHLRDVLARGEVNVAHYYMRRGAYIAAANRARYVVENYQQTTAMPEALTVMSKAYKVLGMEDLATDALRVLELNYPNYQGVEEVKETAVQ